MATLACVAFGAAALIAGFMLSDTLALAAKVNRTGSASTTLILAVIAVLASLVFSTAAPLLFLCRIYAVAFIVIGAYHGSQVTEHDHLRVPLMCLPAYAVLEILYALA
jgi:hypothetical protein